MSLKYRLIVLTVAVFAAIFGVGTLLGTRAARALAERQVAGRLQRSAHALAGSDVPLNDAALAPLAPLLGAEVLVLPCDGSRPTGEVHAHSGGDLPWETLASCFSPQAGKVPQSPLRRLDGRSYYFARSTRQELATGRRLDVVLLADESAVSEPTRTILARYLIVLGATSLLLAAGMYAVGWRLVRRINRLAGRMDQTLAEDAVAGERRGDELDRLAGAFEDLRGRLQRSRRRLAQQQRLATAGKLASSITHEVRNPLQAMRLTAQMLRDRCPPDAREGCELLLSEIERLALLTDELLVLAGKATGRAEPVDLTGQLRETLRLLAHQLSQRRIATGIELPDLPPVRIDRNRCRQLLLNLLLNATEASPAGGTIRVSGAAESGGAMLRIADEGEGFPEAVLTGSAEEFFSTKSSGAGLGLSICRRIVSEAGGRLRLYNGRGGAVAEVWLPGAE